MRIGKIATVMSGLALLVLGGVGGYWYWRSPSRVVERHLKECRTECDKALELRIQELRDYFAERRKNCRAFAEDIRSWGTMFSYMFNGNRCIEERFARYFFSEKQLQEIIETTVRSYMQDIINAENTMLVNLYVDLALDQQKPGISVFTREQFRQAYEQQLALANQHAWNAMKQEIGREIATTIASEILTVVFRRVAVRMGLMGAGAGSGVVTLGAGLLIALIIDAIWDRCTDQTGQLAQKLDELLLHLEKSIIEGADHQPGLKDRLSQLAKERAQAREQAVRNLLREQSQGADR